MAIKGKTKIVATLGPASSSPDVIGKLIDSGMSVARINFSHGTHDSHEHLFYEVKKQAALRSVSVAVLGDLCGPKIRVGELGDGFLLKKDHEVTLFPEGKSGDIPVNQAVLFNDLQKDAIVLLNDGAFSLKVIDINLERAVCSVLTGGLLTSRKGINLPGTLLNLPTITEKDIDDIYFGLDLGLDFFAMSFVQNVGDIINARRYVQHIPLIAKIERPQAVEDLDAIIEEADGVMVARGDLGVEIGAEHVPVIQKLIIEKARMKAKPVITATQMFESMIHSSVPTRAEVSDVANAVLDGTSAVMLSAESASGSYPVEAVSMLSKTICEVEDNPYFKIASIKNDTYTSASDAIVTSAVNIAKHMNIKLIAVFSQTGETARLISRFRNNIPVVALTSRLEILSHLAISWGVIPLYFEDNSNLSKMLDSMNKLLIDKGFVSSGDTIAITFGYEGNEPGRTNTLKLHTVT
ncbi:MAG: pyruvate kinase [Deltaproteobacteria bacterium]|nr:pyruvate kinase [Deltaproteobacteria bacterium]